MKFRLFEDSLSSKITENEILDIIDSMSNDGYPITFNNIKDNII